MNHAHLKSQINIATLTTRATRQEASRLLHKGRKLRRQAESSPARSNPSKSHALMNQGWDAHEAGMALRENAEAGRLDRRHMHLSAALLNGKTYLGCEPKRDSTRTPTADPNQIATYITPHLPQAEKKHAQYIAQMWCGQGNVRLHYIREMGLVRLFTIDKTEAEIKECEAKIQKFKWDLHHAQKEECRADEVYKRAMDQRKNCETKITAMETRLLSLYADLTRTTEEADHRPINGVSDLFREEAA